MPAIPNLAFGGKSGISLLMKTTIELPDDVFLQAKSLAATRQTTLKELLVLALKRFMQVPTADEERKRKAGMKKLLQAMRASNTEPMRPLKREEIYDR
jgi:hypothetical protein